MLILFGLFSQYTHVMCLLSALAKKEIICARWTKVPPSVDAVWHKFLHCGKIEELVLNERKNIFAHYHHWLPFLPLLDF